MHVDYAQNMLTIPGSIVNIMGRDPYDYLVSMRDKKFMGSENYEAYGYGQDLDVRIISH